MNQWAGMNVEEKEDMSRFILDVIDEFGTTIALIEHDMGRGHGICLIEWLLWTTEKKLVMGRQMK